MHKAARITSLLLFVVGTLAVIATYSGAAPFKDEVTLTPVKYDALLAKIASDKKAKLTIIDAWATWCLPCKENFPHVVEMHKKYADKGLSVISLSLDDPTKPKKLEEAHAFLKGQKAVFPNYLLDETFDDAFDKLKISAIPAVFIFGPDGKEVKRFSFEDVNKPFTYDEVEKAIKELLGAK